MNTEITDTDDHTPISNGRRRSKRAEQLNVPGTERVTIVEVEIAAKAYRSILMERLDLTALETERRAELIRVMQEHKVEVYKYDDDEGVELTVKLDTKTKVKVRRADSAKDEDE